MVFGIDVQQDERGLTESSLEFAGGTSSNFASTLLLAPHDEDYLVKAR
jgi:hypothetical protein